jgi:hypothetical protein
MSNNTKCIQGPAGTLFNGYNDYINSCVKNNEQVKTVRESLFTRTIDFKKEFDTLKTAAQADITEITGLIGSAGTVDNANKIAAYTAGLDEEAKKLKEQLAEVEAKTEALEHQFTDDKKESDPPEAKPKIVVLQDYILAALALSYTFFALIFLFLITKKADYSVTTFLLALALFVILGALIYSLVHYLA